MRISPLPLLALFCSGLAQAVEITNFSAGTVCTGADDKQSVCEQTEDIPVTGDSTCNWSGEEKPCTWFGFEFDYENAVPGIPLECTYRRSQPSTEGNYEGVRERDVMTGSSSFELDGPSGHFFNPMYQLYSKLPEGQSATIVTVMACSIGEEAVFDMTFNLHIGAG